MQKIFIFVWDKNKHFNYIHMKLNTLLSVLFLMSGMMLAVTTVDAQRNKKPVVSSYLFAYFSSNTPEGEQLRYAISSDGLNFTPLNGGRPILPSSEIAHKKGIRDPHIIRSEDGKTFYMVMTDMRSSEGWQSNDGLILLKSTDLLRWEHTAIDFPTRFGHLEGFDRQNLHAVWAPQTIWDPVAQRYMVYYSIGRHDWYYPVGNRIQPYFKIFYSHANKDFTDLTEPRLLFDFGTAAIDGDIIWDKRKREYVLFFKDEGIPTINNGFRTNQGVMRATSRSLTGPYVTEFRHVHNTNNFPVEGSSVFKLIDSDEYILMYDCYIAGYYQFCKSSDLKNFTFVKNTPTDGEFTPRHGSVVHITQKEREQLEAWSNLSNAVYAAEKTAQNINNPRMLKRLQEAREMLATPTSTRRMQNMARNLSR